jgi:hypothetical protein
LLARSTDTADYQVVMTPPLPAGSNTLTLSPVTQYGGLHFSQQDVSAFGIEIVPTDPPAKWQLNMTRSGGGNMQVEDLLLILGYEWE